MSAQYCRIKGLGEALGLPLNRNQAYFLAKKLESFGALIRVGKNLFVDINQAKYFLRFHNKQAKFTDQEIELS